MYVKMIVPILAAILAVASAGMAGSPIDADMNDQGTRDALQFAVAQYNRASNDAFVRQVSEVIKVQKQVSTFICTFISCFLFTFEHVDRLTTSQCKSYSLAKKK